MPNRNLPEIRPIEVILQNQDMEELSAWLAPIIFQATLNWKVEEASSPNEASIIVAFSFGCRDGNGATSSGPVNEQLAKLAQRYFLTRPRYILAQTEIYECMKTVIPSEYLVSISGESTDPANPGYLSTQGIVDQVVKFMATSGLGGTVLCLAHHDHLPRCIQMARSSGIDAVGIQRDMPTIYDSLSTQEWTRSREKYLISDMISRLADYRRKLTE